jgi:hypothetical protein
MMFIFVSFLASSPGIESTNVVFPSFGFHFFTLKKEYSEIQSGGTGRDAAVNENMKTFSE